ncbi:MAG: sigma-54-dependent Fis family transcriptional regulator [Acidobacteria bacterium]|nr:sigma-54-dependent Fis family transcriptional regulator [Acidobacteriota bacterium]
MIFPNKTATLTGKNQLEGAPEMKPEPIHIWFCSSDTGFTQVVARALGAGYDVRQSDGLNLGSAREQEAWWNVVLLDLRGARSEEDLETGLRLMDEINQTPLPPPIIVVLNQDDHSLTSKLMGAGTFDTLHSPPDMVDLRLILRRADKYRRMEKELHRLHSPEHVAENLYEMLGCSEPMQQMFALARKVGPCDVNVLITGDTGTGKELLARAMHRLSSRVEGPFVAFSCANLPETLVEDELFGHERGAFTGAMTMRRGRFEDADQGTLFLDEVGDLPLALQAKLLRVLQERSFQRLGGNALITVNFRLLCATNSNLTEMVAQGKFREDLYYRINVMELHMPPLRERREEVPVLAQHFLQRFANQFGKNVKRFSRLALHSLEEYTWPGNVRELENIVQRAVVLAGKPTIEIWHLPSNLRNGFEEIRTVNSYEEEVRDFRRRMVLRTLCECNWNKAEAARVLGIARGYLHRLINQLEIHPTHFDKDRNVLEEVSSYTRLM